MSNAKKDNSHTHIDENGNVYTHSHGASDHDEHVHDQGLSDHDEHVHNHGLSNHDEHAHDHDANHQHSHSHTHDPKEMKKIINRIAKSIGHMEAVKRMLEDEEDCADVLIQMAAVKSEITNAGKALLKEHLEHCIVEAVAQKDTESVEKMNRAIDYFMK